MKNKREKLFYFVLILVCCIGAIIGISIGSLVVAQTKGIDLSGMKLFQIGIVTSILGIAISILVYNLINFVQKRKESKK